MNDISDLSSSSVDNPFFEDLYPQVETEEYPTWQKIGHSALSASFFLAAVAFIPTVTNKKKIPFIMGNALGAASPLPSSSLVSESPAPVQNENAAPAGTVKPIPYRHLRCTHEDPHGDRLKIKEVILTLANNDWWGLLKKSSRLYEIKEEIRPVHPFKFLSTIFTDKQLKQLMQKEIYPSWAKKNGFMGGVIESSEQEADAGNLEAYIDDFAKEVGISSDVIRPSIQARDWNQFVQDLLV